MALLGFTLHGFFRGANFMDFFNRHLDESRPLHVWYLQVIHRITSDSLLIVDSRIPEAAFVGNDIVHGLDTKRVLFCDFLRSPKVKKNPRAKSNEPYFV